MTTKRRYEILLPLENNDGSPQLTANFVEIKRHLLHLFGGFTQDVGQTGEWAHNGNIHFDRLIRLTADVEDSPWNREQMVKLKELAKEKFQQHEIYMTSYTVEVV